MVHHTDKNPLVEVLGSFADNAFAGNSCEKYLVMRYITSMHVDMGMRSFVNFSHEKFLPWNFLEFIGNGIGMPM